MPRAHDVDNSQRTVGGQKQPGQQEDARSGADPRAGFHELMRQRRSGKSTETGAPMDPTALLPQTRRAAPALPSRGEVVSEAAGRAGIQAARVAVLEGLVAGVPGRAFESLPSHLRRFLQ